MRPKFLLPATLLVAGLALTGCGNDDAPPQNASVTSDSSATPSATPTAAPTADPSRTQAPDESPVVAPAPEETPVQAINPPYPITVPGEPAPGYQPPHVGGIPPQNFTYDEAYAAWQNGMPYYDAFCLHYTPVTDAGVSQCYGIEIGTVDAITGEYIGPR